MKKAHIFMMVTLSLIFSNYAFAAESDVTEYWISGSVHEWDATPSYGTFPGIISSSTNSINYRIRSARANNVMFAFYGRSEARQVRSAKIYLHDRTGSTSASVLLSLEVWGFDGTQIATVSQSAVDLQTASTGTWIDIPLSTIADDLVVDSGEYLTFNAAFTGTNDTGLVINSQVEVVVRTGLGGTFDEVRVSPALIIE